MEWALSQTWHAASDMDSARSDAWAGLTEPQLVARAQGGQPDAYGELVRRHQSAVYNIAYRLTGDRQEALDLAQDSFVRAFSALVSFDQRRPFGPWINRIATNVTLNWIQRRRAPTVSLAQSPFGRDDEPQLPDYAAEPERVYLAGEQHSRLREAILALPARFRVVIELRHFQDRSYEEIATMLGIPLSDVKSDLFRARRLLRAWLEERQ